MTEVETGREKLRNLFKVVILVRGKTGVWFQAVWLQVICYPANLLRKNNSKYFPSARHYCKNIVYVSTSSLHKHFTRYAHFLFISQTLSILPHSALGLERPTFGTEHFTLWSLVVFGQWEFPAWDQKVEEKWGHHTLYPSSLPFGSLWVGCLRFSKTIVPVYLVFPDSHSLWILVKASSSYPLGWGVVKSLCCC